jgi:hypothetical protein
MLHLKGGKVEPSDDSERQAEQENDGSAALCHSGGKIVHLFSKQTENQNLKQVVLLFSIGWRWPRNGRRDILSAKTLHQISDRLRKYMKKADLLRLRQ